MLLHFKCPHSVGTLTDKDEGADLGSQLSIRSSTSEKSKPGAIQGVTCFLPIPSCY